MGIYLNPGNKRFQELLNSPIIVDKTLLLDKMNHIMNTTE